MGQQQKDNIGVSIAKTLLELLKIAATLVLDQKTLDRLFRLSGDQSFIRGEKDRKHNFGHQDNLESGNATMKEQLSGLSDEIEKLKKGMGKPLNGGQPVNVGVRNRRQSAQRSRPNLNQPIRPRV